MINKTKLLLTDINKYKFLNLFVIFFLIPVLIHLIFIKFLFKKNTKFYNIILSYYISLISVHGIDHNLGLWSFILYLCSFFLNVSLLTGM